MNVSLPPRLVKDRKRREMRLRCPAHLAFVRSHACCVPNCNLHDIHGFTTEAAHVRTGTDGGTGLKPGDNWTISLCTGHHRFQHCLGEPEFARRYGIDMKALATAFWQAFRKDNPTAARREAMRMERRETNGGSQRPTATYTRT